MTSKRYQFLTFWAVLTLAGGAGIPSTVLAAGSVQAGKVKAAACQGCHGREGRSSNPLYPNLAGQYARYTVKQMLAYKSGARKDSAMNDAAKALSNQDIEDLAAYFESVK